MNTWIKAANPLSPLDTVAQALSAARLSAVALWISGAKWVIAAILMIDDMADMRAAMSPDEASGGEAAAMALVEGGAVEVIVGVTAAIGLFQVLLGVVQWRRPGTVIPVIFLILSGYGLLSAVWGQINGDASASSALNYATLAIAVWFHAVGARGAMKLEVLERTN